MAQTSRITALASMAAVLALVGCERPGGPPAPLKALKAAPAGAQELIGFSVQLLEAPMCRELGYTVDDAVADDLVMRGLAASVSEGFDRAAVDKVFGEAALESRAAYKARIERPGKARTPKAFRAEIEALYGFYDMWCSQAAASELAGRAIKEPPGYDRKAAKDAKIAAVMKTAWIMQPENQ